MNKVAARYAKALLQLAVEKKVLAHIHQDMLFFTQAGIAHKALLQMLKSPIIRHDKKLAVLQAIFQNKVHALTLRFFALVIQRHREPLLPTMAQAFLTQYHQHQGIKKAHVTTTFPLSTELESQLQQLVQKMTVAKKIELDQHIDPTLLGGYVLAVEDKRLDQSLRKKLLKLRKSYITAGY
ncbi:MAG: ATP synthase F1 subunit delta [Bacteroidota bacterium]